MASEGFPEKIRAANDPGDNWRDLASDGNISKLGRKHRLAVYTCELTEVKSSPSDADHLKGPCR